MVHALIVRNFDHRLRMGLRTRLAVSVSCAGCDVAVIRNVWIRHRTSGGRVRSHPAPGAVADPVPRGGRRRAVRGLARHLECGLDARQSGDAVARRSRTGRRRFDNDAARACHLVLHVACQFHGDSAHREQFRPPLFPLNGHSFCDEQQPLCAGGGLLLQEIGNQTDDHQRAAYLIPGQPAGRAM
jgi:hypothetical protein